jgi:hypothetical protein
MNCLLRHPSPEYIITNFILHMCKAGFSANKQKTAKSAAIFLIERLRHMKDLGKDRMVKDVVALIPSKPKPAPRFMSIFDVTILLKYIEEKSPPLERQNMDQLMPRVTALLMIFAMARPAELLTIDAGHTLRAFTNERVQLTIPAHKKTDKGSDISYFAILAIPGKSFCPVSYLLELMKRAGYTYPPLSSSNSSTAPSLPQLSTKPLALFHWNNNKPVKRSSGICNPPTIMMRAAGIPAPYRCYDIRHAAISKLSALKYNFTGHSQRANTAPKHYLHEINNWLGYKLADAPLSVTGTIVRADPLGNPQAFASHSEGEDKSSADDSSSDEASDDGPALPSKVPAHSARDSKGTATTRKVVFRPAKKRRAASESPPTERFNPHPLRNRKRKIYFGTV